MTPTVTFTYRHKGVDKIRRIVPDALEFHHRSHDGFQPGWFLSGHDLDKNARRSFALTHIVLDPAAYISSGGLTIYRLAKMFVPPQPVGDT